MYLRCNKYFSTDGMNMNNKLITIVILTWNRKLLLKENIEKIHSQLYDNIEIIVVDNGSTDGTSDMVKAEYHDIKLIKLENNIGISARNIGIKGASGSIIMMLDDDVILVNNNELNNIVQYFDSHQNIAALAFKILDTDDSILELNWFHPRDMNENANTIFTTDYIPEGAVAFRKSVFEIVGLYPESFFISHEGPDLALRIIDAGYEICYFPQLSVYHKCNKSGKTDWRYAYYDTRNHFLLAARNFPIMYAVKYIIYRMLTSLLFCIKQDKVKWYFKAVYDGIIGVKNELVNRKPISSETIRKIKQIRQFDYSIIEKIKRHIRRHRVLSNKYGKYT